MFFRTGVIRLSKSELVLKISSTKVKEDIIVQKKVKIRAVFCFVPELLYVRKMIEMLKNKKFKAVLGAIGMYFEPNPKISDMLKNQNTRETELMKIMVTLTEINIFDLGFIKSSENIFFSPV